MYKLDFNVLLTLPLQHNMYRAYQDSETVGMSFI